MTDEQLIDPNPAAMRHADDTLAFVDSADSPKLPPTAQARWIADANQERGQPGELLATRDHETIQVWAETRNGKPALLKAADRANPMEALRFQVTERLESEYEVVSWEEWLGLFDRANLVFVYQDLTTNGEPSDLFRLLPQRAVEQAR